MNGQPVEILLVEDDQAHAEITRRNLESCRVANRINHVADGQAALDYLYGAGQFSDRKRYPLPGLILLDLRLPKVDGLEVLARVKADPTLLKIPVVVLTTSSAEADIAKAYGTHANSYLVKPIDFDKFQMMMENFGYYWLAWNQLP